MISQKIMKRCLIASMLLLVGCSALSELRLDMADKLFGREPHNAPSELTPIKATRTAKLDWSTQLGETGRYDYTPALSAGYVYAVNVKGELTKLDGESGNQEWRVNVGEPISGGVGSGGGLILVGTNRGNLLAYDMSGKLIWQSKLSSEVLSVPRYFEGKVIVRSGDNTIYGLDAADGARKWVYTRKVPALSLRSNAGVVVADGAVYAGFSGGKMVAIRADNGRLLWDATVAVPKGVTDVERIADIASLPVVSGPVVYAVAYQGRIAAVDRTNGKVLWSREISSYSGLALEGEQIYVSHALGSLYSLDYTTGRTFWRQGGLLNRRLTTPLLMSGLIAVGDLEGYIHFLNGDNGKFSSRIKVGSNAVMSLIPGDKPSQLIAATRDGGLYVVSVGESTSQIREERVLAPAMEIVEPAPVNETEELEADSEVTEEPSSSILFQKQELLLFPSVSESDSGPGIVLPRSE